MTRRKCARRRERDEPRFAISLSQWSLHRRLLGTPLPGKFNAAVRLAREAIGMPEAPRGVELDPIDFPEVARREFGIGAVDYVGYFYLAHVRDPRYLRELRSRAENEGVRGLVLTCGDEGLLGHASTPKRRATVDHHLKWMDMAAFLGCHSICVRAQGHGSRAEQTERIAESLAALAAWCEAHDLNLLIENHYGYSSEGSWLRNLLTRVGHPRVGLLADWGNFDAASCDPYHEFTQIMPLTGAISAKCHDFNAAGEETSFDFARFIRIVKTARFDGYLGIEYEGSRLSEGEGILACKTLLERLQRAPQKTIA